MLGTMILYLFSGSEPLLDGQGGINRNGYGESPVELDLETTIEGFEPQNIQITIGSMEYTENECKELFSKMKEVLPEKILKDNESVENITKDMDFCRSVDGFPFELTWEVEEDGIFENDGRLISNHFGKTVLTYTAQYKGFTKSGEIPVSFESVEATGEVLIKKLSEKINENEEAQREKKRFELPGELDGKRIFYKDNSAKRNAVIIPVGLVAAVSILYAAKKDEKKERRKMLESIEEDYVVIVQKMVMYLSSGMSIRNVWQKIYSGADEQKKSRPFFMEIKMMLNEMQTGISEMSALKRMSDRINSPEIKRFSTLVIQNLQKGSTDLAALLNEEEDKLLEQRKRKARIKGEEAGTKLLLPMTLLLTVVMAIVMMPAFWNIN